MVVGYTELLPPDQVKEHTALSIGEHCTVVEGLFQVKAVVPYFRRANWAEPTDTRDYRPRRQKSKVIFTDPAFREKKWLKRVRFILHQPMLRL